MILPAISLGLVSGGLLMRIFRTGLTDALGRDYRHGQPQPRRLARRRAPPPRGARRARPVHHRRRDGIGAIFGGAVVVEQIFQIPGLGTLVLNGIETRDYRVLQAARW